MTRRLYPLETLIQQFEKKERTQALPASIASAAMQQARDPLRGPCTKTLAFVLSHISVENGKWYYKGGLRLTARAAGLHLTQVARCFKKLVKNGLLMPLGKSHNGKIRTYQININLKQGDATHGKL